jgi:hypothetical protein
VPVPWKRQRSGRTSPVNKKEDTMNLIPRFAAYAAAFEESLADDE